MKMRAIAAASIVAVFTLLGAGCATTLSSRAYSRDQTMAMQNVQMGVVEAVHEVTIEGTKTPIGAGAGAIVGGIAGSELGRGRGSLAGTVLGALAGGLGGAAIEEGVTRRKGVEIAVRLDDGNLVAVTQEGDVAFRKGDRVMIVSRARVSRVERVNG